MGIEQLRKIYSTMLTIKTCGSDTLTMAACIQALGEYIEKYEQDNNTIEGV